MAQEIPTFWRVSWGLRLVSLRLGIATPAVTSVFMRCCLNAREFCALLGPLWRSTAQPC